MVGRNVSISFTKQKVKDLIFNKFSVYRWIDTLTSPGTLLANIFDIIDGSWNGQISIKTR